MPSSPAIDAAAIPTAIVWPPYGHMHLELEWVQRQTSVPGGFTAGGRQGSAADWETFVRREVTVLRDRLWPEHDRSTGNWVGGAASSMTALTVADLDLYEKVLKPKLAEGAPSASVCELTHWNLFRREDNMTGADLFLTLDEYLKTHDADKLKTIRNAMVAALGRFGPPPLRFKHFMQRPRPYQASWLLKRDYDYRWGLTAVTAALPSGHCMQGLFASCGAYLSSRFAIESLDSGRSMLALYGAHVGDRRVFAGVHYPSDNIASWYVCLRMCKPMFGALAIEARDFMVECIIASATYQAISSAVAADAASAYAQPLAWIKTVFDEVPAEADAAALPA